MKTKYKLSKYLVYSIFSLSLVNLLNSKLNLNKLQSKSDYFVQIFAWMIRQNNPIRQINPIIQQKGQIIRCHSIRRQNKPVGYTCKMGYCNFCTKIRTK